MPLTTANPLLSCHQVDRAFRMRDGTARKAALAGLIPSVQRPRGRLAPTILIRESDAQAYWGER